MDTPDMLNHYFRDQADRIDGLFENGKIDKGEYFEFISDLSNIHKTIPVSWKPSTGYQAYVNDFLETNQGKFDNGRIMIIIAAAKWSWMQQHKKDEWGKKKRERKRSHHDER